MSSNRRLDPRPWDPTYLILRGLGAQIARQARARFASNAKIDVIDVGCGDKPYEAVFRQYARSYVGVDILPGPNVDIVAPAEALPIADGSFDCAICSQVLEHAAEPVSVVAEMHRVLRPRGAAFTSTHGVYRYHPSPDDYWRWTHAGLARLFEQAGQWSSIDVYPNGDFGATLSTLVAAEVSAVAEGLGLAPLVAPFVAVTNVLGRNTDRALQRAAPSRTPTVVPNYLVVAVR